MIYILFKIYVSKMPEKMKEFSRKNKNILELFPTKICYYVTL